MATTIENFYNIASQKQFSRDFFMRVKQVTVAGLSLNGENDLVFARTATLPGRDIENKTVQYSGQNFNVSGKSSYPGSDSYAIEFYMDQALELRTKLEKASRALFNNETTSGAMCMPGPDSFIILDVLDIPCGQGNAGGQGLQVIKTIKLVGASIRTIGQVEYQIADGTGEIQKLPSTWSYHWYDDFSK